MNSKGKMILQILLMTLTLRLADSNMKCGKEQPAVTKIINSIGFRLEKLIDNRENYFFSPLSISVALAMVYIGARGTTREQMSKALEYNIVGKNCLPNKISENFQDLIHSLHKEGDDYSLLIANGAFIQTGFRVSHFYKSNLEKYFHSHVSFLNFADEEYDTMKKINVWVANATKGKIGKLLNEPLDPMTIMVLVNAVYFKGLWDLPFNATNTKDGTFYRIDNTSKVVPFMLMDDKFLDIYYDEEKRYHIVELEYVRGNISMILILPKDMREFPRYDLTSNKLCEVRKKFQYKGVTIVIPKFNLEFKRELSKDMIKLGMEELFSDRADLTGIREQNDLHVSVMVHKAMIEVNEVGSEASAISGIGIDGRKVIAPNEIFLADHPFLFYIIHKETNTILFSGRVVDP